MTWTNHNPDDVAQAVAPEQGTLTGTALEALVQALAGLIIPVHLPADWAGPLRTSLILDTSDAGGLDLENPNADLLLLLGVKDSAALSVIDRLVGARTKVVLAKLGPDQSLRQHGWDDVPFAVVSVHSDAQWTQVHSVVDRFLRHGFDACPDAPGSGQSVFGTHTDLFGLANTLAELVGGMVSIDDEQNRVLAFSPLDETADEIRKLSILGRNAPPGHLLVLHRTRIFESLRSSPEVFELQPVGDFRRRLCVGIHDRGSGHYLGTIWVQEGQRPFAVEARPLLRAGAEFAARLIDQARLIPSLESEFAQTLIGLRQPGPKRDIPSRELNSVVATGGRVVGFRLDREDAAGRLDARETLGLLNLHATSFVNGALVVPGGRRIYVLLPTHAAERNVIAWARRAAQAVTPHVHRVVQAAVSSLAAARAEWETARREVDRVLDAMSQGDSSTVKTLSSVRTRVLLSETMDLLGPRTELMDPRLTLVHDYDARHRTQLMDALTAALCTGPDVKSAAASIHVHPNTLRYRLRRAGEVGGFDLQDPDTRFLIELNLRAWRAN